LISIIYLAEYAP
jgi:hypothetical protein